MGTDEDVGGASGTLENRMIGLPNGRSCGRCSLPLEGGFNVSIACRQLSRVFCRQRIGSCKVSV